MKLSANARQARRREEGHRQPHWMAVVHACDGMRKPSSACNREPSGPGPVECAGPVSRHAMLASLPRRTWWLLALVATVAWFASTRSAAPAACRRGALCRDRARDGGERRLGDAAAQRPQVLREAAAAVLARRRDVRRPRRQRMDRAPALRHCRLPRRDRRRLHRRPPGGRRRRRLRGAGAGRVRVARRPRAPADRSIRSSRSA